VSGRLWLCISLKFLYFIDNITDIFHQKSNNMLYSSSSNNNCSSSSAAASYTTSIPNNNNVLTKITGEGAKNSL
jgi:hypothetical protein